MHIDPVNNQEATEMAVAELPNVAAMVASAAAMVTLGLAARRLGGQLGTVLKLVVSGIGLAVFLHAGAELAGAFDIVDEHALLFIMGALVTVGSLLMSAAGVVALRALR